VRKRPIKDYFPTNDPLIELIRKMLEFNPNKRITVDEALKDPILKEHLKDEV
jgi:serine/threonine protein kinase